MAALWVAADKVAIMKTVLFRANRQTLLILENKKSK